VVAVGDDQLARAGQPQQVGAIGPNLMGTPGGVDIGDVRLTGPGDRRRERLVQARRRLEQQYRRQQVPGGADQRDPFADLLHEHVLVADDQPRLVGARRDLRRVDHGPQAVRRAVLTRDPVERGDAVAPGVPARRLRARQPGGGRR
jgi:hypothetical protein